MNLPHIMVDLETLGTGDHAPIIQIGAVRFDWRASPDAPEGWVSSPYGEFRRNIKWRSSGFGTIDPDTMLWWLKQDERTRQQVFDQDVAVDLTTAIADFYAWVQEGGPVEGVWADSPSFDLRLLRQAAERVRKGWIFTHRQERDVRTLKKELAVEGDVPEFVGKQHDALDDAHFQALLVCNVMRRLHGST